MTCKPAVGLLVLAIAAACAGCATRPAPDIAGRWKPVNRFAETTQEIPLQVAYVFYPSPTDGTLKSMLERWSADSSRTLDYQHPSDFTLSAPVAGIRTGDLQDALAALGAVYAEHGVALSAESGQIIVRRIERTARAESASAGGPARP